MEKKENTGTKLSVLLCNLVDYVRGDDRPLVFAVMQEITEYFEQELDKAREEGKLEYILSLGWQDTNNEYVKEVLEDADRIANELSKLKDNK